MESTQTKPSKPQKPQLSPYQEGVRKALSKSGEQHTLDAIMQGVPPEHIEKQSGLFPQPPQQQNPNDVLQQLLSTPEAQQILALSQAKVDQPGTMQGPFAMLAGLLQGKMVNPMAPRQQSLGMDTAIKLQGAVQSGQKNSMDAQKFPQEMQNLVGTGLAQEQTYNQNEVMNPLQAKKAQQDTSVQFQDRKLQREESIKSGFKVKEEDRKMKNEFFSKIMSPPQPLSGESAAKYQFTKDAEDASGQLLELLDKDPNALTSPDMMWNNQGQRIGTIAKRLRASLVPARAGATQSPAEIKLIKDMSSPTGFKARMKDPADIKFRLSEINRSMKSQGRAMNPSASDRELGQHLLKKGHSKEDVTDYLLSGGKK